MTCTVIYIYIYIYVIIHDILVSQFGEEKRLRQNINKRETSYALHSTNINKTTSSTNYNSYTNNMKNRNQRNDIYSPLEGMLLSYIHRNRHICYIVAHK